VIVAKVGGSLFDLPDLRQRLDAWLATVDDACVLLAPGGGAGADVILQFDRTHRLGDEASHWLALRVVTVNAHFLSRLLAVPVISSIASPIPRGSGSTAAASSTTAGRRVRFATRCGRARNTATRMP